MAFGLANRSEESIKENPLKLAGISTVFCHSNLTSAFAETTTTSLAFISTAQLIAVNDLPNLITAYISKLDLCLLYTASLKLSTAICWLGLSSQGFSSRSNLYTTGRKSGEYSLYFPSFSLALLHMSAIASSTSFVVAPSKNSFE